MLVSLEQNHSRVHYWQSKQVNNVHLWLSCNSNTKKGELKRESTYHLNGQSAERSTALLCMYQSSVVLKTNEYHITKHALKNLGSEESASLWDDTGYVFHSRIKYSTVVQSRVQYWMHYQWKWALLLLCLMSRGKSRYINTNKLVWTDVPGKSTSPAKYLRVVWKFTKISSMNLQLMLLWTGQQGRIFYYVSGQKSQIPHLGEQANRELYHHGEIQLHNHFAGAGIYSRLTIVI